MTKVTFDEVNLKIIQERNKYCRKNPTDPLSVTKTKNIVPNIMSNPLMISSDGTTFVAAIEHNVA